MNAPRPHFSTAARVAACLMLAGGAGALGGCAGLPFGEPKVDPTSPVAAEVTQLIAKPGKFPTFASIPQPPKDVRPAPQYGRQAAQVEAAGQALIAATEPGTWTLNDTDAFAEQARKAAGPALEPADPAAAEAFARELRERATPPPPR